MTAREYCKRWDRDILRDINDLVVPLAVLEDARAWKYLCRIRARYRLAVTKGVWPKLCARRGAFCNIERRKTE